MHINKLLARLFVIVLITTTLFAQGRQYEGPEDSAGDPNLEREGKMTGNRVLISFKNNTELGDWPRTDVSRWPNNNKGTKQNDGVALLICSQIFVTQDSIPVDKLDLARDLAARGELDTLYYCQTNYREEMDRDPTGTIEWGFHPPAGYSNINSETPSMSNDPSSWPPNGWPATGFATKWPGEWDGRFGRGVKYADLESYIVANDAQDQEYLGEEDVVKYYPRPGKRIGYLKPDITIQRGHPWGGLGLRVEMRGFQWNNPYALDAIFWEYTIANISDYDLPQMTFGYYVDNNIGGDGGEDAYFSGAPINMCYAWDRDGVATGGVTPGVQGFAYLESPGASFDGVDNDRDGIIDESRDNLAMKKVGPTEGIADLTAFLNYYNIKEEDLKEHWDADEDQDWADGNDVNKNGRYDSDEYAGDDIGTDGVAPGDLNYFGPDADGSECNHRPDFDEGIGAEPNFASVDITESDMLGLTTFRLYDVPQHVSPYINWFRNDKSMWELCSSDSFSSFSQNSGNQGEAFASGIFPLYKGLTERISMAELHSYEELAGLKSSSHSAPVLLNLKKTVQVIYEKDYRFAQPPLMPTLTATPGDGYVILSWDNRSDQSTREPFLRGANDFEGYKIYRSTDKFLADPEIVTDGFGTPIFKKPIFQCDIIDNRKGFTDFALKDGTAYYLGNDTGISHSFIDSTVQNGRTYYYALVAYDYGIHPDLLTNLSVAQDERYGIPPSENNAVIELNEAEDVDFIGKNVAIVTPGPRAAGQTLKTTYDIDASGLTYGNGTITPEAIIPNHPKNGHTYKVKFEAGIAKEKIENEDGTTTEREITVYKYSDRGFLYTANGIKVYDITDSSETLVYEDILVEDEKGNIKPRNFNTVLIKEETADYSYWHLPVARPGKTDIFDGIRLNIKMNATFASYDPENSGWLTGNAPINLMMAKVDSVLIPWEYHLVFTEEKYLSNLRSTRLIRDEYGFEIDRNYLQLLEVPFYIENRSFPPDPETGEYEKMGVVVWDMNQNGLFDWLIDRIVVGAIGTTRYWGTTLCVFDFFYASDESQLPQINDVYKITHKRPFWKEDSLIFTINSKDSLNTDLLKSTMKDIKVVPNPYVATNLMESAVANSALNQDRRIMFNHIPEECEIKIFTISGVLVKEINAPEDGLVNYSGLGDYNTGAIHWDMRSKEGLEIAAGMYIFHVKDKKTGEEKIGKFAVIK